MWDWIGTDSILEPLEPTSTLFETQISPVVKAAMEGFNGTVFAYAVFTSVKSRLRSDLSSLCTGMARPDLVKHILW
jgi:hypothetical protein